MALVPEKCTSKYVFVNEVEHVGEEAIEGTTLIEISEEGQVERMEVVKDNGETEILDDRKQIQILETGVVAMEDGSVSYERVEFSERSEGGSKVEKRGRPRLDTTKKISDKPKRESETKTQEEPDEAVIETKIIDTTTPKQVVEPPVGAVVTNEDVSWLTRR